MSELFLRAHRYDVSGISTCLTSECSSDSMMGNKLLNLLACYCSCAVTAVSLGTVE